MLNDCLHAYYWKVSDCLVFVEVTNINFDIALKVISSFLTIQGKFCNCPPTKGKVDFSDYLSASETEGQRQEENIIEPLEWMSTKR